MCWKYWRNTRRLSDRLIFKTKERISSDWDFWRERGRDPELLEDDLGFDVVAFYFLVCFCFWLLGWGFSGKAQGGSGFLQIL
ncbi:hypothetical protein COP1_036345 [Malus domestica]